MTPLHPEHAGQEPQDTAPLHTPPEPARSCHGTWRPASLLWRFIAERASGRFSRASANSRDTMPPNSMSSLQPPHFQPSPGKPWCRLLQPQMAAEPSAHERVTAKATPAEAMACTKADSRVAVERGDQVGRPSRGWVLEPGPWRRGPLLGWAWAPGVGVHPELTVTERPGRSAPGAEHPWRRTSIRRKSPGASQPRSPGAVLDSPP